MKDPVSYFEKPFDKMDISRENFATFCIDFTSALKHAVAQGEPVSDLVNDTDTLVTSYVNALNSVTTGKSVQVSETLSVDQIIAKFKAYIANQEGLIRARLGKDSKGYKQFFPQGLSQYSKVAKKNINELLAQLIKASNTYKTEIGPETEDQLTVMQHQYQAARETQNISLKAVKYSSTDIELLGEKLKKQMYLNFLKLAIIFVDTPGKGISMINSSLLYTKHRIKTQEEQDNTYTVTIPANTTKEAGFAFSVDKTMLFSNTGSEAVLIYGAASVDAPLSPTAIEILSGEEKEITATQLGAPANRFILIKNKSLLVEAEVEILFV